MSRGLLILNADVAKRLAYSGAYLKTIGEKRETNFVEEEGDVPGGGEPDVGEGLLGLEQDHEGNHHPSETKLY